MKNLITYLKTLWSWVADSQSTDISLDCRLTVGSPSGFNSKRMLKLVSVLAILLTVGVGNVWGAGAITVTSSAITLPNGSTTVGKGAWMSATGESQGYWSKDVTVGSYGTITCSNAGDQNSTDYLLQLQASGGYIQTTINSPAGVDITIGLKKGSSGTLTVSLTGATNKTYTSTSWGSLSISTTNTSATLQVTKTGSKAAGISYITITPKAAASCTANPTVGNAANNGALVYSTAPMTVPITCPSIGAGSASCSIKDYGFVWKAGGNPTISNNKTQIGTDNHSTAFNGNISGTFAAGTTYYVKAYAINNGDKTTLSTGTYSFTPRSITMNSNGGSAVTTILVISGTAATQPANPTKTGYTFGGWYTDNGTFASAVNWSSNITSNQTYYAKWTAKTTTVSFNQNSGTGGQTSNLTATYGSAMPAISGTPTREGYDFGGYYDGSGGTGTKYYNADGSSATNWDKENSTWTLYAKWTVKSYSVTWKVNNTNYSAGGSTSVNHGSRVATLPTAPDPGDYCGDKFVGWTTDAEYVHNTSPLFTAAGSAPVADGAQIFYAVFADYDE